MGRFNEILVGRYNRLAQKLFSMKGPASVATLADEMMPVFQMDYLDLANAYLLSWETFFVSTVVAAAAGNNGGVKLRNPAGSNLIAVILLVQSNSQGATAGTPALQIETNSTTDLGTPLTLTGNFVDKRGRTSSSLIASSQNTPTVPSTGATLAGWSYPASSQVIWPPHEGLLLPLLPGEAYQIRESTVNQALGVSVIWRERFLEESERF